MGCGCMNKHGQAGGSGQAAGSVQPMRPAPRRASGTPSDSYSDSMGCMRCLAKHLSKAAVEAAEYAEERGRESELALCIGDLACAEDHAKALGLPHEAERIRSFRDAVWNDPGSAVRGILRMASSAVRGSLQRMAEEALASVGSGDSNDSNDSNDSKEDSNGL